jgi:hypothetical protein
MRNRVADRGVRTLLVRVVVVMVLVPATLAVVAAQAGADPAGPDNLAAAAFSLDVARPVGIVAVLLGVGGLVVGLLRRRIGSCRAVSASRALLDQRAQTATAVPVKAGQGDRVS